MVGVSQQLQTFRHPEWKRLYDEALPLISTGKREFSYAELSTLAGVDITSTRGRHQFLRCAREIRRVHRLHFENVRGEGYRIIAPNETPRSMARQTKMAARRLKGGMEIGRDSRLEEMRPDVATEVLRRVAVHGALIQQMREGQREDRKRLAAIESKLAIVEAIVQHEQGG